MSLFQLNTAAICLGSYSVFHAWNTADMPLIDHDYKISLFFVFGAFNKMDGQSYDLFGNNPVEDTDKTPIFVYES